MIKNEKDWSPAEEQAKLEKDRALRESMMTVKVGDKMHNVELYNDDHGHGLTACGLKVGPWDRTDAGEFTCLTCITVAKRMASK